MSAEDVTTRGAGGLLQRLRVERGIGAHAMATAVGLSIGELMLVEINGLGVTSTQLIAMAGLLGMDPLDLARLCREHIAS